MEIESIRGKKLIQALLDLPEGYTLYLDSEEIQDLELIDNFTWYSVNITHGAREVYIKESAALT